MRVRRPSRQDLLDVLMAVGAFGFAWVAAYGLGSPADPIRSGDRLVGLLAEQTLPLVFRRWAPLRVLAVIVAANVVPVFPGFGPSTELMGFSFPALLLALYTVNAHRPRRIALAATCAVPTFPFPNCETC